MAYMKRFLEYCMEKEPSLKEAVKNQNDEQTKALIEKCFDAHLETFLKDE